MERLSELSPTLWRDALTLLCGEEIGQGADRTVFAYALDEDFVIKMEVNSSTRHQNVMEYRIWQELKEYPRLRRWFAPVRAISGSGHWLIQQRTTPVTLAELRRRLPRVPQCLTDLKVRNWGKIDNRIVCHDYGLSFALADGLNRNRLTKADWWE